MGRQYWVGQYVQITAQVCAEVEDQLEMCNNVLTKVFNSVFDNTQNTSILVYFLLTIILLKKYLKTISFSQIISNFSIVFFLFKKKYFNF